MPRSLAACYENISASSICSATPMVGRARPSARRARRSLASATPMIDDIFVHGLHEFIEEFITENNRLGNTISEQYLQ